MKKEPIIEYDDPTPRFSFLPYLLIIGVAIVYFHLGALLG